jgi:hypothetical protein
MRKLLVSLLLTLTLFGASFAPVPVSNSSTTHAWAQAKGNPNVKVWVNTNSGVYHCPGTRWYGNTKEGEYMSQRQALAQGNRPAYGNYCQ